jgi:hypothetical protein
MTVALVALALVVSDGRAVVTDGPATGALVDF